MATRHGYLGNIRAPEFPVDLDWLNTERPLSLRELRGKFVLLDFWTYGCINCMHIIPDLKKLEAEFPDELVVIGVHSAKFANEGDTDNIRRVILRYGIEHPVVNDHEFQVWRSYVVRAWPTSVLIDPRGRVIAAHSGEGVYNEFRTTIMDAIQSAETDGHLDRKPLALRLERDRQPDTILAYPGKILADEAGKRLFVADSSHHRVLVTDLSGRLEQVIGEGIDGFLDGASTTARFSTPQGMALAGELLYVADTGNHAIRVVDLIAGTVGTLAGTGEMGYWGSSKAIREARLNSPWDLELLGDQLYIAMAGNHQIWALDLSQKLVGPFAGTGAEALVDGKRESASLAQPSGITSDGRRLYFADSEASAIRVVELDAPQKVHTLVGTGLFDFGDVDGPAGKALMQHPLGVHFYDGKLYVADTYNHKIKVIDPVIKQVATFVGDGIPGWIDGPNARFYEPGGLSSIPGKLLVADTNNHQIRVVDLASGQTSTMELQDPQGLLTLRMTGEGQEQIARVCVRPGPGRLVFDLDLEAGLKINRQAPSYVAWHGTDTLIEGPSSGRLDLGDETTDLSVPVRWMGPGELSVEYVIYYCPSGDEGLCYIKQGQVSVPIELCADAATQDVPVSISLTSGA